MKYAYDEQNRRIEPRYSGQIAYCPICKGKMISKCGEIYARHWQHDKDRNCDPWKEQETYWHRQWKYKFPENWQEVIIESNYERHIADVMTGAGVVIEFQNSSISGATIRIREAFYKNMIWVVNAKSFKDHFKMRSVVNSKLREIEEDASDQIHALENELQKHKKSIDQKIVNAEMESGSLKNKIEYNNSVKEKLVNNLQNIDTLVSEILSKWKYGNYYHSSYFFSTVNILEKEFKSQMNNLNTEINNLCRDCEQYKNWLTDISKLPTIIIENKEFKIINYSQVTKDNYNRVRVILKSSKGSLFPQIVKITSNREFFQYEYKQNEYDFAIDPSETIQHFENKIKNQNHLLEEKRIVEIELKTCFKERLVKLLQAKIEEYENLINEKQKQLEETEKLKTDIEAQKQNRILKMVAEIEELKSSIEKTKNESRFNVMREQKGKYTFYWKYERKSWKDATRPIYFDTGDGYLFEKCGSGLFKKISIEEFVRLYGANH
jgi:hypothetical protein